MSKKIPEPGPIIRDDPTSEQSKALITAVRQMVEVEKEYGSGYYGDPRWNDAYDEAARLVGESRDV